MVRHYGLDWLRIGAFALLIFYHVGMVFVPWGFHAKLAHSDWATVPMLATNPWRLALLFLVSGYASRALLARSPSLAGFARYRTARLVVPLLFGVIVVVPPQSWVELATQHGYGGSFLTFWTHDYFRFGTLAGIVLPTWNHLWFVLYLWLYTLALALLVAALGRWGAGFQRAFDRVFGGIGLFVLPTCYLLAHTVLLFPGGSETHALVDDTVAHANYIPAFLFGFGLAGSERALAAFARNWWWTALVALAAYGVAAALDIAWFTGAVPPSRYGTLFSGARGVQGWMAIAALIGIAERFWNRDHRWRATLTEAVFPFYIIHQTVIVVVAWWLLPTGLSLGVKAVILIVATIVGCWSFYLVGRRFDLLRPLIGLRPRPPRSSPTR